MQLRTHIRALLPSTPAARSFAVLALLLGSLYAVFNPPFAVNDERDHWLRVVEISKGRVRTRSDEKGPHYMLPRDHASLITRYAEVQRNGDNRVDKDQLLQDLVTPSAVPADWGRRRAGASGYSPVPYLPHIPAVWAARVLRLPPIWQVYFARCTSLLCYTLITAWTIAIAGRLGWTFFVLGLTPMSLTQAAGLSGDGMAIAVSFSFFAFIAKGMFGPSPLSRRELGVLLIECAVLPLCRPPYLLFTGALLVLRWEGESARRWRWLYAASGVAISAATQAAWMYFNRSAPTSEPDVIGAQLAWITQHPGDVPQVLANTLILRSDDLLIQFVVVRDVVHRQMRFLGGLVCGLYVPLLVAVTWGAARSAAQSMQRPRWATSWIVLLGLATCGAIVLAMWLAFTPLGADYVSGVQGRYLIPVAPAFLLALSTCGRPALGRWLARRAGLSLKIAMTSLNLITVLALLARYYGTTDIEWPY
jgi:uncharacterized membrane protein